MWKHYAFNQALVEAFSLIVKSSRNLRKLLFETLSTTLHTVQWLVVTGYWYNVWNMTWALRSVPSWRAETIFTIIYHRLPPAFRLTDHWDSLLLLTITQYHTHCNDYKTITQFHSLLNCSLSLLLLSITQLWLITKVTHYNITRIRVIGLTYVLDIDNVGL